MTPSDVAQEPALRRHIRRESKFANGECRVRQLGAFMNKALTMKTGQTHVRHPEGERRAMSKNREGFLVETIEENGGGPEVQLRKRQSKKS